MTDLKIDKDGGLVLTGSWVVVSARGVPVLGTVEAVEIVPPPTHVSISAEGWRVVGATVAASTGAGCGFDDSDGMPAPSPPELSVGEREQRRLLDAATERAGAPVVVPVNWDGCTQFTVDLAKANEWRLECDVFRGIREEDGREYDYYGDAPYAGDPVFAALRMADACAWPNAAAHPWETPWIDDDALGRYAESLEVEARYTLRGSEYEECLRRIAAQVRGVTYEPRVTRTVNLTVHPSGDDQTTFLQEIEKMKAKFLRETRRP